MEKRNVYIESYGDLSRKPYYDQLNYSVRKIRKRDLAKINYRIIHYSKYRSNSAHYSCSKK